MSVTAVPIFYKMIYTSWREVKRSGEHHVTILEDLQGGVELMFYAEPDTKSKEGGPVNTCHMQEKNSVSETRSEPMATNPRCFRDRPLRHRTAWKKEAGRKEK